MRLAASLALVAMLLVPGTVAAQEPSPSPLTPTPALGFSLTVLPILVSPTWTADTPPETISADAADIAARLRTALLSTIPEPCYHDAWVATWLAYADLVHIAGAEGRRDVGRHLTHLADDAGPISETLEACMLAAP